VFSLNVRIGIKRLTEFPSIFSGWWSQKTKLLYFYICDNPVKSMLLNIQSCDSSFVSKLPYIEFPKIWNKLSYCAQNALISQAMPKKQLKAEMLSHYWINVRCVNTHCRDCQQLLTPLVLSLYLLWTSSNFMYIFKNGFQLFFLLIWLFLPGFNFGSCLLFGSTSRSDFQTVSIVKLIKNYFGGKAEDSNSYPCSFNLHCIKTVSIL